MATYIKYRRMTLKAEHSGDISVWHRYLHLAFGETEDIPGHIEYAGKRVNFQVLNTQGWTTTYSAALYIFV